MQRIGSAAFAHNVVLAVYDKMPGAAVPVVETAEDQNARSLDIKGDVEIICDLIKKMTAVRAFVASIAVIRAAHIRAHPNALLRPAIPLAIRVETNRNGLLSLLRRAPAGPCDSRGEAESENARIENRSRH